MTTAPADPRTRRLLRWLPALAWMGVIFGLSSMRGSSVPGDFSVAGHLSVYLVLGAAYGFALAPHRSPVRVVCLAVVIASLYGISDEFHQSFVPGRQPDVMDWATDTIGALAGVWLFLLARARTARRRSS